MPCKKDSSYLLPRVFRLIVSSVLVSYLGNIMSLLITKLQDVKLSKKTNLKIYEVELHASVPTERLARLPFRNKV